MNLNRAEGVPDFVLLEEVTEEAFYDNLKLRFSLNNIYTYIGDVVISVNPFKKLNIYSPNDISNYQGRYKYERPPHIYALANDAYRMMTSNKQDQCIIISGESGAGKTEASKIIMQFITAVSKSSKKAESIKQALLESNPVLEAFGNAKTLRNDNSSRFGKYIEMQFSVAGAPIGGKITNYLLEKSRVVTRFQGERSFHIFYQMFAGLPKATLEELSLGTDMSAFNYLNMSNCLKVDSIDDKMDYTVVRHAMTTFGFDDATVDNIWKVLAGILHLGNITFSEASSSSTPVNITNKEALTKAAACLSVTQPALQKALTYRSISVDKQAQPQQAKKAELIFVPYDQAGAYYSRDALAKAAYERLFSWLVEQINTSIHTNCARREYQVIGLLDIYGFEIFKVNSFEQLNINYCNEKLQQLFIELTLKAQQEEYVREGIEWKQIDYFNNKTICDLIEKKPIGIINVMDDECLIGAGTDASFLDKLNHNFSAHAHYQSYLTQKDRSLTTSTFRLKHYAGDVAYDVTGMLDKNKDTLFGDLVDLIVQSKMQLLQDLFLPMKKIDSKKRPESAGSQFRTAINALIQTLLSCNPHYVRCIKPNDDKRSGYLDDVRAIHQIRYLGLLENVRVQRAGFAYRQEFGLFYQRYKMLCKKTWPNYIGYNKQTAKEAVSTIVTSNDFTHGKEYVLGKTKIFIQNPTTLFYFEEKRAMAMPKIATLIQKIWRGYKARCEYARLKAAITLECYVRLYRTRNWYKRTLAATMIQKIYKGFKDRREWKKRKSAIKIQLWYRWVQSMKWIRELQGIFAEVTKDPLFGKYNKWPEFPTVLARANSLVGQIHLRWRVRSMIKSLNAEQTAIMKEKIVAYDIFHTRKTWSFFRPFDHNYLTKTLLPPAMAKFEKSRADIEGSNVILFADLVMKLNSKGAVDKRLLVVTETHLQQFKPRNMALRGSIPIENISSISMNSLEEWTVVISTKRPSKDIVMNLFANGQETATELVTVLYQRIHKLTNVLVPIVFTDSIQYEHYKQAVLTFQPSLNGKLSVKHVKNDAHVLYYPLGKIAPGIAVVGMKSSV